MQKRIGNIIFALYIAELQFIHKHKLHTFVKKYLQVISY